MKYQDIETKVQTDEGLEQILFDLKETFTRIDEQSEMLKQGVFSEGEEASKLLMESTGLWDELKIVYEVIDTYKSNKELRHYHMQKIDVEGRGEKFNSSATEKEASALVIKERRVRNVIGAYMCAAEKNVLSCQSLLKYLSETYKRLNHQEG